MPIGWYDSATGQATSPGVGTYGSYGDDSSGENNNSGEEDKQNGGNLPTVNEAMDRLRQRGYAIISPGQEVPTYHFDDAYGYDPSLADDVAEQELRQAGYTILAPWNRVDDESFYTSDENGQTPYTPDTESLQSSLDYIDQQFQAGNITFEMAETFKNVVRNYPPGIADNADEILNTFEKIRNETIDPYYRNQVDMIKGQFQSNILNLETQHRIEREQEEIIAAERMRGARGQLEASGMTFSGEGVRQLGTQSALEGATGEGQIPQYNRMIANSSAARREAAIQNLGGQMEQQLGTGMGGLNLGGYNPYSSGWGGNIEQNRQSQYGQTLSGLLGNYQQSQQFQTQQPFNFNTSL